MKDRRRENTRRYPATYRRLEVDSESALTVPRRWILPSLAGKTVSHYSRMTTKRRRRRRMWFWWRCGEVRRRRSHRRFVCSGLLCHGTLESRSRESADGFIEARFIGPGAHHSFSGNNGSDELGKLDGRVWRTEVRGGRERGWISVR